VQLEIGRDLDPSEKLWRYMSLAKFVNLLDKQSLWLARADTVRDKHEGRFPDEMRKATENAYKGFPADDPSPVKDAADFQDYLVKNTFMSCWQKNLDENMIMWEIYGRNDDAVVVQTSVASLRDNIDYSTLTATP